MSKEKEKKPEKIYYTIKLDVMAPMELSFRVLAESPEEAAEMISKMPLPPLAAAPRPDLSRMRKIKARIYKYGLSTILFIKQFGRG